MTTITISRNVRYHGDTLRKGTTLAARPIDGGWVVDHPRVAGATRMVPEGYAKVVRP